MLTITLVKLIKLSWLKKKKKKSDIFPKLRLLGILILKSTLWPTWLTTFTIVCAFFFFFWSILKFFSIISYHFLKHVHQIKILNTILLKYQFFFNFLNVTLSLHYNHHPHFFFILEKCKKNKKLKCTTTVLMYICTATIVKMHFAQQMHAKIFVTNIQYCLAEERVNRNSVSRLRNYL